MATAGMKRSGKSCEPIPVSQLVDLLDSHYASRGVGRSFRYAITRVFREVVSCGNIATSDQLSNGIKAYERIRRSELSEQTYYSQLSALRAACNQAVSLGLIASPPEFPFIPQPSDRVSKTTAPEINPKQLVSLIESLRSRRDRWETHRLYAVVMTVVYGQISIGDVLKLPSAAHDPINGTLSIPRRTSMKRSVSPLKLKMAAPLATTLRIWQPYAGKDWLFPNKRGSNYWHGGSNGKRPADYLREECEPLGFEATFHSLLKFARTISSHTIALEFPYESPGQANRRVCPIVLSGEGSPILVKGKKLPAITGDAYRMIEKLVSAFLEERRVPAAVLSGMTESKRLRPLTVALERPGMKPLADLISITKEGRNKFLEIIDG